MASYLYDLYHLMNYDLTDARTVHLPLILRPFSMMALLILYNYVSISLGPKLMANRPAFDLKKVIIAFDIFQIIINSYLFYFGLNVGYWGKLNFFCAEMDYTDNEWTRQMILASYIYFLVKLSDLADTMFLVLKKKNNHISFLHVYHHTGMVILGWTNSKYISVGHHLSLGVYNTFVHAVMYSYYLIAALFPQKKLTRFKKCVTQMQMIQFFLICLHNASVLITPGCNYPRWPLMFILPNNAFMFILFYDFYRKAYVLYKKRANIKQS